MPYFALFCLVLGFCVGFGAAFVWMGQVKRTALSISNAQAGIKGREAKTEQEGELMAMLIEAGNSFKAAKAAGKDMKTAAAEIVPGLLAKHPLVAMRQGKKLIKIFKDYGGMEGLEELF